MQNTIDGSIFDLVDTKFDFISGDALTNWINRLY